MPHIKINPAFEGAIVPTDLLKSEGTLVFEVDRQSLQEDGELFHLRSEDGDFTFALSFQDTAIVFQRNDVISVLNTSDLPGSVTQFLITVRWKHDELYLRCGDAAHSKEARVETSPVAPPPELMRCARQMGLLPVTKFDSKEKFRRRVYSSLESIGHKVNNIGSYNPFWNIEYDGNSIESRSPKKETDIHPTIHCIISDIMFTSSIDVIPEYQTAVGDVDFAFLGQVEGSGMCKLFSEFKLAHSSDIFSGLTKQLPAYMRRNGLKYGAYCVLSFKGQWFDKPSYTLEELDFQLKLRLKESSEPLHKGIRVFTYDLSKPVSASKR